MGDVSLSTVSRRMTRLETDIGTELFDRLPTGYRLTAAGMDVLEEAQRIQSKFVKLGHCLKNDHIKLAGIVRITMPDVVVV